jgi:very-short-patch-repair endonuclease
VQRKAPLRPRNTLDARLWARLREIEAAAFRRKVPFRSFILDFVAHDAGLVISLEDGEPGRRSNTIVRDRLLSEQGYVILRLKRQEVAGDLHGALHRIKAVLEDLSS